MTKAKNIDIGYKNNRLTMIEVISNTISKFQCNCGKIVIRKNYTVISGNNKSCGCLKSDGKHKMTKTRFYNIWSGVKNRCLNPNCNIYCNYGAKGIQIDDEWLIFNNFNEDMYESYLEHSREFGEKQTTIDRIDSTGNYCKDNCRWATYSVQTNNTKINNKNTSGYKGISFRNINGHNNKVGWRSYVIIGEKQKELGVFNTKK